MRSRLLSVTSALLLFVFPGTMVAADMSPMVLPSGAVRVNGDGISLPTALLSGGKVETLEGSASVILPGSNIQVAPKTFVSVVDGAVTLQQGSIHVASTAGLSGHVLNLEVRGASAGNVQYDIQRSTGRVMVAALEGKVLVKDGHDQMLVEAGHSLSFPVAESQATQQQNCPKDSKDKNCTNDGGAAAAGAGAQAGAAGAGGAAAAAGSGAAGAAGAAGGAAISSAVLGTIAAAAAAAASFALTGVISNPPSSPTQ